ncbi:pyridoxamine 5'-phosphate oxidase family protein [Microbacterium rhizosphaerae]|uniref:Pyridoxamine 5'-phosphate oxidase family protein n=1 Tax=Microbacterium rhizosphaerae TaxID=1678237 RepID=A0ABZ0SGL8_9MICO|nr:pyridoxamine 5'-phosphate oxidase family protein [Microbacterium rhizosphaerae]WPR88271.1 pyridoxamine 5'-phosphate oxidase family protein [Microbacterium rhizosphaerae]
MSASAYSADSRGQEVETLGVEECWRLLRLATIGRLAVSGLDGGLDIVPLNYLTYERCVYFRTAPGSKLGKLQAHPEVAFEIDGQDDRRRWSVVVHGTAHLVLDPAEIERSGIDWLISWNPTAKSHFVRIDPDAVTGRRFPKHYHASSLAEPMTPAADAAPDDDAREFTSHDGVLPKPWPIPHRTPTTPGD